MEISLLKSRICNGYMWLRDNPTAPDFSQSLALYESLVDEARKLGIEEKDCWPVPVEEAMEIFAPTPKVSQLFEGGFT